MYSSVNKTNETSEHQPRDVRKSVVEVHGLDDPQVAVMIFRMLRDELGNPDIVNVELDMTLTFDLDAAGRERLDELARLTWSLGVQHQKE